MVDQELPAGQAHDAFTDDGGLVDPDLRSALADLVDQLLSTARTRVEQLI